MISIYPPVTIKCTSFDILPVEIQLLDERLRDPELMPEYKTAGASGMDLRAMAYGVDPPIPIGKGTLIELWPGSPKVLGSGLSIALPPGYEAQVRPRSSLASRGAVAMIGTIDSDYRGQIGMTLINLSQQTIRITAMDRVAQLVIAPVVRAELQVVDTLPPTDRGSGGYGSTGVR